MTNTTSNSKAAKAARDKNLPPKPYTEYTIFFRLERTFLLQSTGIIDDEVVSSLDPNHQDPLEFPRPPRYQGLALPPYWYSSSHKKAIEKRRKHRKREGRMDLKTLSKTISVSWRNAERGIIEYCRMLARAETETYNKVMDEIMAKRENGCSAAAESVGNNTSPSPQVFAMQPVNSQVQVHGASSVPMPAVSPSTTPPAGNSMMHQGSNFNKVMGYGQISEAQTHMNNSTAAVLKMLKFRQLQAAIGMTDNANNISVSPNPVHLTSTHMGNNMNYNPLLVQAHGNLSELSKPEKPERKRKFVRRVSAPPECTGAYLGINSSVMINALGNTNMQQSNNNVCLGEDISNPPSHPEKKMRRRASMTSMPSLDNQAQYKQLRRPSMASSIAHNASINLSSSFKDELQHRGSFTCVPEWKKEDADTLLNMLSEPEEEVLPIDLPQVGNGNVTCSDMLLPSGEQEQDVWQMFMQQQDFNEYMNVSEMCGSCS